MTVMHHTTPKISPTVPSPSSMLGVTSDGGNEPGWIIVETASHSLGGRGAEPGGAEVDDGIKQTMKWGYGIGALLFLPPLCFLFCFLYHRTLFSSLSRHDVIVVVHFAHTAARALSRYD
jgi:hypothetical protein